MSRGRFTALLVAALVVICGATYLSSRRNESAPAAQGAPLLPTLANELASVSEVDVRKGGPTPAVTLHRVGEQWTVAQRANYPADTPKLHRLLLALGDAHIVEEKTADPGNFSIIGVEDPGKAGSAATEITVVAQDGKHAVIVGKPIGEGNFVRRAGQNQSYTIEPAVSADAEPRAWIDSRLIDVPTASIQSVQLIPPANAGPAHAAPASPVGYTLRRLKSQDGFELDAVPAGRKALDAKALAPSSATLSGLTADDVAAASDIDFSKATQAVFTLTDGNVITLTGVSIADKRWVEVQSTKDAALAAKTRDRAFDVASYRFDAIFRPLDQLLVPKEVKEPAKPANHASPGNQASPAASARKPVSGVAKPVPQASPAP